MNSTASMRKMTSKVEEVEDLLLVEVARLQGQTRQWMAASW